MSRKPSSTKSRWSIGGGLAVALCLVLSAPPAGAHGDLGSASPADGSRMRSVPPDVTLSFTEPPAPGAQLTVTDGCGNEVGGEPTIDGSKLVAEVADAQPGRWRVTYRFISDVDGHESKGRLGFVVAGKAKCGDGNGNGGNGNGGDSGPDDAGEAAGPGGPTDEDGGSFPWALVVGGGVALAALGLVLRRVV